MAQEKSTQVYHMLQKLGFEEGLCKEIAYKYMNTEYTAKRMIGYLQGTKKPSVEEVVDEMLAIISDRDRIMQKYEMEHTQAKTNQIYRNGLDEFL